MTFIVAEVGSNWASIDDCIDSISVAKQCGADAVKFQLYTPSELYGYPAVLPHWCLQKPWLPKLKIAADACGIELMCTAFSEEGVDYVDKFVKRHKIASAELSHKALLERVRGKNKPVLLSTGGSSLTDVRLAVSCLGDQTTLLYCVANYPAEDTNLYGIDLLRQIFPAHKVGYSCHTTDISASVTAVKHHGAEVVEKHFKLRADMETPDAPHSIDPQQFKLMVKQIHGDPLDHVIFPSKQESAMLLRHNRRLIISKEVKAGQTLVYGDNFGIYRSLKDDAHAITGFAYDRIDGKTAMRDMAIGDGIGPGDFR